jgi:hypothetical protein
MAARKLSDSWVSRGGVKVCERFALCELPRERVLAAPGPHDQDLHERESRTKGGWFEGGAKSGIERI